VFAQWTKTHRNGTGFAVTLVVSTLAVALCLFCPAQPARGSVVTTGDVQPADPTTWTSYTTAYIGMTAPGTLAITEGSAIASRQGYIGYNVDSSGAVTVDGVGSSWANAESLAVGFRGGGTLTITGGGKVNSGISSSPLTRYAWIGYDPVSTGDVTVIGAGSTWTHASELVVGFGGHGTLLITGGG